MGIIRAGFTCSATLAHVRCPVLARADCGVMFDPGLEQPWKRGWKRQKAVNRRKWRTFPFFYEKNPEKRRHVPIETPAPFTGKSLTSKPLVQPEPFQSAHQWPICDFSAPKPANPHDTAVRDGVGAAGRLVPHELFCPHIADRAPQACGHKSSCGTRRPAAPPPYIERIFINLYQKNHISATGEHFGKALVVPVVCW